MPKDIKNVKRTVYRNGASVSNQRHINPKSMADDTERAAERGSEDVKR